MKRMIPLASSITIAFVLIIGAFLLTPRAQAQIAALLNPPFAGKLSNITLCCNGVRFDVEAIEIGTGAAQAAGNQEEEYESPIDGDMIFPWQNMIPIPFPLGWGLYQGWKIMDGTSVLGRTSRGGQCQLIYTYCEESENVDYTVLEMGTKQKETESNSLSGGGSAPSI